MTEPAAQRARRAAAGLVLALNVVSVVVFVSGAAGPEEFAQHLVFAPMLSAYAVVATAILWRRSHPIGWLLLLMGAILTASHLTDLLFVRPSPPGSSVPWRLLVVAATLPFPLFAVLLPALGLRFPDGRPVAPRWRWVDRGYAAGVVALVGAMLLAQRVRGGLPDGPEWTVANPLWSPTTEVVRRVLELTATATLFPAVMLAIVALVARFRRARGVERQQLRWLVVPLGLLLGSWPLVAGAVWLVAGREATGIVSGLYPMLVLAVPPVGMGVAITRHGLYDLQRLVSRTVAYATLVFLLAGLYAAAVIVLGAAARALTGETGDLVVALSTLTVAAASGPVRHRVRGVVDRRFNRRQVDAVATLERFAQRLRDQVDLGQVTAELASTAGAALAPSDVAVLLVDRGERT